MSSKHLDVIGLPYNFGQMKPGVASGPVKMREAGIIEHLQKSELSINDVGDLKFESFSEDPTVSNVKRPRTVGVANKQIADAVAASLKSGHCCLTLGGDHSLAIGSIYGQSLVEPDFGVIWVDAHGDINPPMKSPSGNAHGMPLSFLVHELASQVPAEIPGFEWVKPCLHLKDIAYIAVRDLDDYEKELLSEYCMAVFSMEDVRKLGIETVVRRCLNHVNPLGNRRIHLSFDIDALDPEFAPSTGTPVPGGLTLEEGVYVIETVARTGNLTVVDLAEVNPELGSDEDQAKTLDSANKIVSGLVRGLSPREE